MPGALVTLRLTGVSRTCVFMRGTRPGWRPAEHAFEEHVTYVSKTVWSALTSRCERSHIKCTVHQGRGESFQAHGRRLLVAACVLVWDRGAHDLRRRPSSSTLATADTRGLCGGRAEKNAKAFRGLITRAHAPGGRGNSTRGLSGERACAGRVLRDWRTPCHTARTDIAMFPWVLCRPRACPACGLRARRPHGRASG